MDKLEEFLQHHGVKGMKWGVRRNLKKLSPGKARTDYIKSYDKKWEDKVNKNPKATKVAAKAAKEAKKMTKELNNQYKEQGYSFGKNSLKSNNINNKKNKLAKIRYESEVKAILEASLDKASYKVYGNSPSRFSQVNISRNADGTLVAKIEPRSNEKLTKQQIKLTKYDQKQAKREERQAKREERQTKREDKKTVQHSAKEDAPDYNGVVWIIKEDVDGFFEDYEIVQDLLQSAISDYEDKYYGDASPKKSDVAIDTLLQSYSDVELKHFGVIGMKWGVRRDKRVTLREKIGSAKRERQWRKVLKEVDNLSDDEIKTVAKRIGLENDLKRLAMDGRIAGSKDRKDYIRRAGMDDQELNDKVNRLKTKENLVRKVDEATKEQREQGEKIVNAASSLALTYMTNKKPDGKQIYDAITNVKDKNAKDNLKEAIKNKATEQIIRTVLNGSTKS